MIVRLKYNEIGGTIEKGLQVQVKDKNQLKEWMAEFNISPGNVRYFGAKECGEKNFTGYDPATLEGIATS